jgi:hypothetical protein
VWYVARRGEKRNAYKILVRNPEGKRLLGLGRPRCRWVDNIKIDVGVVWIESVWLRIGTSGELL